MKIIFAGTPEFAAIHLKTLLDHQIKPIAIYTQPDRPSGRGHKLQPSAVKQIALDAQILCLQPTSLRDEKAIKQLQKLQPDLILVVAYGLLLPAEILAIPRFGCLNVHASLLPRWRGAAPIIRAIEAGDTETGICIMQMDAGLDTGDVLLRKTCAITAQTTGQSLHDELAELGSNALLQVLADLPHLKAQKQALEGVTYAHKISKNDAIINWQQSAAELDCKIRAFYPYPAAYTFLAAKAFKIMQAQIVDIQGTPSEILQISKEGLIVACGENALKITKAQLPGGKVLDFAAILAGHKHLFKVGNKLG